MPAIVFLFQKGELSHVCIEAMYITIVAECLRVYLTCSHPSHVSRNCWGLWTQYLSWKSFTESIYMQNYWIVIWSVFRETNNCQAPVGRSWGIVNFRLICIFLPTKRNIPRHMIIPPFTICAASYQSCKLVIDDEKSILLPLSPTLW